jgi:hypothetical protein
MKYGATHENDFTAHGYFEVPFRVTVEQDGNTKVAIGRRVI